MASNRSGPPALGHEGSKVLPPGPQVDSHHTLPYIDNLKPVSASGSQQSSRWWSMIAGAAMPRKNSVGFSETYAGDSAPPFCLEEEASPQKGSGNFLMPPPGIDSASRSPPIRRRSPIAVDPSPMDVPSPSDEFLTQYWSKHHGSGALELSLEGLTGPSVAVVVSDVDDGHGSSQLVIPPTSYQSKNTASRPIATKLTGSIHMEDFPVATKESLAKLDVLKKEILASDFGEKKSAIPELAEAKASPEVPEHKELEHHHVHLEVHEVEKPPGKLVSFIMKQPFAQNWFFRNPNADSAENPEIKAPVDDSKQKRQRLKGMNVWAPQNL